MNMCDAGAGRSDAGLLGGALGCGAADAARAEGETSDALSALLSGETEKQGRDRKKKEREREIESERWRNKDKWREF